MARLVLALLLLMSVEAGGLDTEAVEAFESWMSEKDYPEHKLKLHDFGDEFGWGLKATAPIKKGEVMLRVPEAALMYPKSAITSPLSLPLKTRKVNAETLMALHLMFESSSKKSAWKQWLALLPKSPVTFAMLDEDERDELLEGAHTLGVVRGYHMFLEQNYAGLIPELTKKYPKLIKKENYSPDRFKWANAVLLSRAFATKISGQNCFAFAPLADFFNHKPDIKTTIRWKNDHLEFIAGEAYAAGEQAFLNYGSKKNTDFAMYYGLITPNSTLDYVPIVLNPKDGSDLGENDKKLEVLKEAGLWKSEYHLHRGDISDVLKVLRVFYMDKAEMSKKMWKKAIKGKRVSQANEGDMLAALTGACQTILGQFPTNTKKDLDALKTETDPMRLLAIRARLEEKMILRYTMENAKVLRKKISDVQGAVIIGDDPNYADVVYSEEDKEFYGVKDSKMAINQEDGQLKGSFKVKNDDEDEEDEGDEDENGGDDDEAVDPDAPRKVKFGRKKPPPKEKDENKGKRSRSKPPEPEL